MPVTHLQIIKESFSPLVSLNDHEWAQLMAHTEIKMLKKNNFFLQEGQVCNSLAFVIRGILIYTRLLEDGKELTTDFAFERDWVTDNRSRLSNSPSLLNIKTIEDSELLIITNENLNHCYIQIPKLERLGRFLMEQAFVKIAQQSIDLQTLSASERYEKLLQEYPEIVKKIPQYHIANFLGINPKSLSRIRKGQP